MVVSKRIIAFRTILTFLLLFGCEGGHLGKDGVAYNTTELVLCDPLTNGHDSEAMTALLDIFSDNNPNVDVTRYNDSNDFSTLIESGLVDSFWSHAGQELLVGNWFFSPGDIDPVTSIFNDNGWLSIFSNDIIDLISRDGEIWSVPLNIHRSNVLWYNKQIFTDNSLTPPATINEFLTLAATIEGLGKIPIAFALKNGIWVAVHMFESFLLASMTPEQYRGLWNGTTDWNETEVENALNDFVDMFSYVNSNYRDLDWEAAAQLAADGDAAMYIMGDWTNQYFKSQGLTPNVEYGWVPSPDTSGDFIMSSDTFTLCKNAPNRENAIAWLTTCGSKEGQDAFNTLKGGIPARTDYNHSLYDEYQQYSMDEYTSNEIVPSLMHGAAANGSWLWAISNVMEQFVEDIENTGVTKEQAVSTAQSGLVQAYQEYGN